MTGGTIEYNEATGPGGGIGIRANTTLTIQGGTIGRNTATTSGGGIFAEGINSIFTIENGIITGNTATNGGGIGLAANSGVTITDSSIINNTAVNSGGGIHTLLASYNNITTSDTVTFRGNTASQAYEPPAALIAGLSNIEYASTSIKLVSGYVHPINNYDINFLGGVPLNTFTITYYSNLADGQYFERTFFENQEHEVATLVQTGITRPGFELIGWNTMPDGTGTAFMAGDMIVITGDIALYAQWREIPEEGNNNQIEEENNNTQNNEQKEGQTGAGNAAPTADDTNMFGYITLMGVAMCGMLILLFIGKKKGATGKRYK